jgi:hypothetical protein
MMVTAESVAALLRHEERPPHLGADLQDCAEMAGRGARGADAAAARLQYLADSVSGDKHHGWQKAVYRLVAAHEDARGIE